MARMEQALRPTIFSTKIYTFISTPDIHNPLFLPCPDFLPSAIQVPKYTTRLKTGLGIVVAHLVRGRMGEEASSHHLFISALMKKALDHTALPHTTSHGRDDTFLGVSFPSHLNLPTTGIPPFLQVSSDACANSFLFPLSQFGGIAQGRQFGWGHSRVRLIPAATGALGVCQQPE